MSDQLLLYTVKGLKWSTISQVFRQVLQYTSTVILVSLIAPDEFGLMAMAVVITNFLEIFKDFGTGSAIIHIPTITEEIKSTVFWLNVFVGFAITALIFLSSPFISEIYGSQNLQSVLEVLSLNFFVLGFSILQKSLLEKELIFEKLDKIEIIASFLAFIVALILAFNGYGVWSLVFQVITNSIVGSLLILIFSKWKPRLFFSIKELKKIKSFSLNLVGFNIVNFISRNGDYFLIGKYLGENELGHYYLAYKIMLYPVQNITQVVSRVFYPSFSKIQNKHLKFQNVYKQMTTIIAILAFPMMAGLALVSFDFTHLFFSNKWDNSLVAWLIIILAPVGALQSVISTIGNIYMAKGKTDWMFRWSMLYTSITLTGFIIGLNWGVMGVALSYLITNLVLLYPAFTIPFRLIDLNFGDFSKNFVGTILSVIAMCFITIISYVLMDGNFESLTRLIVLILLGLGSYLIFSWIINREKILSIFLIWSQYRKFLHDK